MSAVDVPEGSDLLRSAPGIIKAYFALIQDPFSCVTDVYEEIERTLSAPRLSRYMPAAGDDRQFALRLYIWNIRLCECFYLPVQFAEVAARNAILKPLQKRFKAEWYQNKAFQNILPTRLLLELNDAVSKERRKHKSALAEGHVVSALSLGFWVALMGASYDKHLWHNGISASFPNADKHLDRAAVHLMLDDMRKLRNDIMHHAAVFDRHPQTRLNNVITVISLISAHTGDYVTSLNKLNQVINLRPTC